MWVTRATICEEVMPTGVSAMGQVAAWVLLLTLLLFHGAHAESPDEANLLRFLETAQPDFRSVYNTSVPACDWAGIVSCIGLGAGRQIWTLTFKGRGLTGTILQGTLGALKSLQSLDLSNNLLTGDIPLDIFALQSLTHLGLGQNRLTGGVPHTVSDLVQLAFLDLSQNMLSGPLPETLGEFEFLKVLDLHSNNFTGAIPVLSKPTQLQHLDLSDNQLSGEVPWAFDALVEVVYLNLSRNLLTGAISWQLERLGALQVLDVSGNDFEGPIPSFGNLRQLKAVSLSSNRFNGSIPLSLISQLPLLQNLMLANNKLTGVLPVALSVSILVLDCSNNSLNGSVPAGVLASPNLAVVRLASNNFTGSLPTNVSGTIRELDLGRNSFSGSVPRSIATLPALELLELSSNQLNGSIPWGFNSIRHVGLGGNSFQEGLLPDVSRMVSLVYLNLSSCNLGGSIILDPFAALGKLVTLDLSHNHLNGSIPKALSMSTPLKFLDASFNNLSGAIPSELTSLASLTNVNFSYNRLSGEVPRSELWDTFKVSAFEGNPNLCGYILNRICSSWMSPTTSHQGGHHHRLRMGAIVGILIGSIVSCCGFVTVLLLLLKSKQQPKKLAAKEVSKYLSSKLPVTFEADPSTWAVQVPHAGSLPVIMFEKPLLNLTFADLLQATANFHKDNQIADGGYGPSYKGTLPGGFQIVVKTLFEGGPANELEKAAQLEALGKIRHPNLVSLVGYCLVGDERLLVYEFMENGDLQRRLHELPEGNHNPEDWSKDTWESPDGDPEELSWPIRHGIALGVARALAFLHHGCSPHLVHRDVTSSNILLDAAYAPHLADCGLAALLVSRSETPAIGGALGYVPPEYGHMWKASTRGDVYSFGVVLLELVTGKRPTGHYFHDSYGGNLVGWVRALIREKRGYKCLDPKLASTGVESEMLETLRIGYLCTAELPSKRPTMQQIVGLLKDIQPQFATAESDPNLHQLHCISIVH